jgi:putative methyltransferase
MYIYFLNKYIYFCFRTVYAVEIDAKRFETLSSQIETTHAFCVKPVKQDALTLDPKRYFDVEYILVDPSCSGSGKILLSFV